MQQQNDRKIGIIYTFVSPGSAETPVIYEVGNQITASRQNMSRMFLPKTTVKCLIFTNFANRVKLRN